MIQKIIIPLSDNKEIVIVMHYDANKQIWYCEMDDETLVDIIGTLNETLFEKQLENANNPDTYVFYCVEGEEPDHFELKSWKKSLDEFPEMIFVRWMTDTIPLFRGEPKS